MSSQVHCSGGRMTSRRNPCRRLVAAVALALACVLSRGAVAQVVVDCPVPVAGTQTTHSRVSAFFDVFPDVITLEGDVSIQQGDVSRDGIIPIEIVAMNLTGSAAGVGSIHLRESPTKVSAGRATQLHCEPAPDGTLQAYVMAFFDVFVEVTLPDQNNLLLTNPTPVHMVTLKPVPLDHKIPGVVLTQQNEQVPLVDAAGRTRGTLSRTVHELVPPTDVPSSCFPPAGKDIMDSTLLHDIDIVGIGLCRANLAGPVVVERSNPYIDLATGLTCIDTKMVDLNLTGVDPVCGRMAITLNPYRESKGLICEKVKGTCFPANSCFEVFVKVELLDLGLCLYACQPAKMCCMISQIPPFGCLYNLDIGSGAGPIPLYRGPCAAPAGGDPCAVVPLPPPVAYIIKAVHQPEPPRQCSCYPKAGEDVMNTTLVHQIVFPGLNLSCTKFTGPIVVRRSDPFINDQGLCCIKTEIVHMEMKGDCGNGVTAVITLCPDMPSTGLICEKEKGKCFPANSCFNVFFQVVLTFPTGGTVTFKNCDPAIMCCMIDRLPPIGCPYQIQNAPISLYRVTAAGGSPCKQAIPPVPDGILQNASHTPDNEPKKCCPEYGPGVDVMQSQLLHDIDIPGIGRCAANLSGPVTVKRGEPYQDPLTGLCCVETEMIGLDLQGADPVCGRICINLDPRRPSRGRICSKQATACFPATSCFEVFVRVQLKDLGITLVSCQPAKMCCMIDAIPPFGCLYQLDIGAGDVIPLYEESSAGTGGGAGIASSCIVSDDGTGTVSLPPDGCQYLSPDQVHMIVDGLPAGTTIELGAIHKDFICRKNGAAAGGGGGIPGFHCGTPGGSLGGEQELFTSSLVFDMNGTGSLAGFHRMITIPNVACMTSTGKRTPGDPVQSFDTEMDQLQGQLPPGDPDFDLLRVTAGNAFGLPSPGHTTLTRMPGGSWTVDSFFDITYRIDFVGHPGGPLGGRSGSTTGTIRMQAGGGGGGGPAVDPCQQSPPPNPRAFIVKAVHQPKPPCDCFPPAGEDTMQSELSHRIRLFGLGPNGGDLICDADMSGPVVVKRSAPYVDPATGLCCIDTEMLRLELTGVDPICGPVMVHLATDVPTKGKICQKPTNPTGQCFPANSFFDVFIEVEIPSLGVRLRNCAPTRMECMIDAIPPINCVYELNLTGVPLYKPGQCSQLPNPNIRPTGLIEVAQHVPRQPCDCPYGPGVDIMDSTLSHDIFLFGFGKLCGAPLTGVVEVERGMTYKTADGLCCVSTRMRKLELSGIDPTCGPVKISLSPDMPSRGKICQMMPGACFPATSCFEVFIQVEVMDMVLVNCQPAVMCCKIDSLPPFGCTYQINLGANVPLFKKGDCGPNGTPVGEIRQAVHVPRPCGPVGIKCDVQADGSVVVTAIDDPNCPCEGRIVITRSIDGGPPDVLVTAGVPAPFTDKPCAGLPAGTVHTVKYCAQCVRSDGVASELVCCDVRCGEPPPPDCIETVTCTSDGGKVVIRVTTKPGCPCDRVIVTLNGRPIGTVPVPADGVLFFPCAPGEYCVQCVDAAGVAGPRHCCVLQSCQEPHGGLQIPGDCNQDGTYDISDAICKFGYLFLGFPTKLPCSDAGGNMLVDVNGDGNVDISDGAYDLNYLFSTGRPPVLGTTCQMIEGCTDVCTQ